MAVKQCTTCRKELPLTDFCKKSERKKDGLSNICKECRSRSNHEYYLSHKTKIRYKGIGWHLKKYGLTRDAYRKLYESQDGLCAICLIELKPLSENRAGHTAIDHCHATGITRALLCMACNSGLGYFKDNADILVKAAQYVTKAQRQP